MKTKENMENISEPDSKRELQVFEIHSDANSLSVSGRETKWQQRKKRRRKKQVLLRLSIIILICLAAVILSVNPWQFLRLAGYPEVLIEKAMNYPEARRYVLEYPLYKDKHVDIDVSGELEKGKIPLFLQWDNRWGYEYYGTSFIGVLACGPTALSMVYCGLTGDDSMHPLAMAQYAEQNNYYVKGAGTAWDFMKTGAENLGLHSEEITLTEETIKAKLNAGKPVICIMMPGDFTVSGHFIVLTGVDKDGRIQINDANSRIKSEKNWDIQLIIDQAAAAWAYSVL